MKKLLVLICVLAIAVSANATLHVRGTDSSGGQLIYDDQQDITWYDFNPGSMPYYNSTSNPTGQIAPSWVSDLSITFNGQDFSDWRFPKKAAVVHGDSPAYSEMGHLFYNELGGTEGSAIQTSGDPDLSFFTNINFPTASSYSFFTSASFFEMD